MVAKTNTLVAQIEGGKKAEFIGEKGVQKNILP